MKADENRYTNKKATNTVILTVFVAFFTCPNFYLETLFV